MDAHTVSAVGVGNRVGEPTARGLAPLRDEDGLGVVEVGCVEYVLRIGEEGIYPTLLDSVDLVGTLLPFALPI